MVSIRRDVMFIPSRRRPGKSWIMIFSDARQSASPLAAGGIFNRSHYEEVIVVRVHPDMLMRQKLPPSLLGKDIWNERFEDIRAFELHLARNGIVTLKFFL